MGGLFKVAHIIGWFKRKKEMIFYHRFKLVFYKYYNKWCPRLTPRKKWSGSVGHGSYKILVKIVEENKGSYKEICCIFGPDPRW